MTDDDLPQNTDFAGNFDEYQHESRKTAIYPRQGSNYFYPTLGLVSEAGEVADRIKRIDRDDNGIVTEQKRAEVAGELGDILWYAAQVASEFGLSFQEIAGENLVKLQQRKDRGTLSGF